MATVADIQKLIETIAPVYMKEEWDHVGLNCGRSDKEVKKILVALDPFEDVCREAVELGADLLVTHHALIWTPGFVTDGSAWGKCVLKLIENGIACINAHTNLDCAPGGVNDVLAGVLGLEDIRVICPAGTNEKGTEYGLLRCGYVAEKPLDGFLEQVKHKLGCPGLRYCDGGRPVRKVAVGGGACAGEMLEAAAAGCDTFVTADVKYNQFFDAKELGLSLVDAGHFYTENPVVPVLAAKIADAFPEISVEISQKHADCMKFF